MKWRYQVGVREEVVKKQVSVYGKIAVMLLLVKCYDNKMVQSPQFLLILPLGGNEEAHQEKKML